MPLNKTRLHICAAFVSFFFRDGDGLVTIFFARAVGVEGIGGEADMFLDVPVKAVKIGCALTGRAAEVKISGGVGAEPKKVCF